MKLTIPKSSLPVAHLPLESIAPILGVSLDEAALWCKSGQLPAIWHKHRWWVQGVDLSRFVERCTWKLVAPPSSAPRRRGA